MSLQTLTIIAIAACFIWIGFVAAISFMEAWVKFKAPGVNLKIGLGIGKLVFAALNKVEWCLALIISAILLAAGKLFILPGVPLFLCFLFLALQTFVLLPKLNNRANKIIAGRSLPKTKLHFYYIGIELLKLSVLFYIGIELIFINFL